MKLATAEVRLDFVPDVPGAVHIPVEDLTVDGYHWNWFGFDWAHAHGSFGDPARPSGWFDATDGRLDAAPAIVGWHGRARVHARDGAPETGLLTGNLVSGPVDLELSGGGDIEQVAVNWVLESQRLGIGPLAFDDVSAHGRFAPRGADATGYYHAVYVDDATGALDGGPVHVRDLVLEGPPVGPDRGFQPRDLSAVFDFSGVDLARVLPTLFPSLPLGALPFLDGTLSARGTLARQHHDTQRSDLDLEIEDAHLDWHPPLPSLVGDYHLVGALRMDGERLALERVVVDRGDDRARLAGTLDLASGKLDLEPYLRLGDVGPLARRLGLGAATGRFVLKEAQASGTLDDPRLTATLNWTEASLEGRRLEKVQGKIDFHDGVLHVIDVRSKNDVGQLALDGEVRMLDSAGQPDARLAFAATRLSIERLALSAITPELGPNAHVDVESGHLTGSLADPLGDLRGKAHVLLRDLVIGGEPVAQVEADLEADGDHLAFKNWRARLPSGGAASGNVTVGVHSRSLRGRVELAPLSLKALGIVAHAVPDLDATIDARLDVGGTVDRPTFIGTIGASAVSWGDVALGDAHLNVLTRPDGRVDLSALDQDFWRGVVLDDAVMTLDGFRPRRLEVSAHATDLALSDLVPAAKDQPVSVIASASAHLDLGLAPGSTTSFEVHARPNDIRLTLRDRGQVWTNATELELSKVGDVMRLEPVSLGPLGAAGTASNGGASAPLQACGTVGRTLDMHLAGQIELAFVPFLTEVFAVTDGRFLIASASGATAPAVARVVSDDRGHRRPADESDARGDCLGGVPGIAIRGTPSAPAMTGRLVSQGVVLVPRGSGRELRLSDGSTLVLVPGDGGAQSIVIPSEHGLAGELDDGTFSVSGRVELASFLPDSAELDIVGADLFVQRPGEFSFTASPRGHFSVHGLQTASPSARLSGALAISEGRFSKSFDTFAQAFGGAVGGRADAYSQSMFDNLPWLGQTRLDVDVTAAEFQIVTALPLARTDLPARLDLSLGGTFAKPTLYRRIDLIAGGTLTYFVFERAFQVTTGAIDFDGDPERPLVDVTAQSQITYLARASTSSLEEDEKEVTITLHITGRVPDLKIELSSDDATFDQADIQSLLLTGKPRGDLDRAQESRVFSADLANVLNTVFKAPFVKTASVAVGQQGNLEYRLGTCFAPNLCFDTTTVNSDAETTLKAKFSLTIGDNLVCEGTLSRSDVATTTLQETYEARCRYRIPLE
ncbi:MAG: translocation/assembly module TamB domain-containing protein [Myxococcota bacterium]